MAEGAPLLREYGLKAHRGFESRIRASASFNDVRIYDLRHSCASARSDPTPNNLLRHRYTTIFTDFPQAA